MIRKLIIISFLTASALFLSQTQIKVVDEETQEPVPYAKLILKGKDYYKNTEENGVITLEQNEEIDHIESFGYENQSIAKVNNVYFLSPKFKDIEGIKISKPKFTKIYTIGSVKKNHFGFMSGLITWEVLNFFANPDKDDKTYIKKIRILTEVKKTKRDAVFNLVFYENTEGHAGSEKLKNIVASCKKGKNITEVDFSGNPITFPKEGLFIGVEWIMNEQNHYLDTITVIHADGTKEKNKIVDRINPFFYGYKSSSPNITGRISGNPQNNTNSVFKFANAHNLSMEIEITN